jgi:hypothetical protein
MRALATLLAVLPIAVLADGASPSPRWSLGAGVSTSAIYISGPGDPFGRVGISSGPAATASLERRLSDSNWLVLGVNGSVSDSQQLPLDGTSVETRWESRRLMLDLGLRHVLTGPGALVDVSLLALAQGGYWEQRRSVEGSPSGDDEFSSWTAGANVGLALDRELTAGLSLRVATPFAGVWWQKNEQKVSGSSSSGHGFSADVFLAPRLELRLAF